MGIWDDAAAVEAALEGTPEGELMDGVTTYMGRLEGELQHANEKLADIQNAIATLKSLFQEA